MLVGVLLTASVAWPAAVMAQQPAAKPRARDLGVPFDGTPGPLNAITDVTGVEVGHTTLISGEGEHATRTGVTVVFPKGKKWEPVFAGTFAGNGFGDLTGTHWVDEGGVLGGPVAITNTWSVGTVRDAVLAWFEQELKVPIDWHQPVVGETSDATLNDIAGFHVRQEHVFAALNGAKSGSVAEGNVGGGTGMVCHGFKGGIGTSSRRVTAAGARYTVGVLVQANHGSRPQLTIAGVPVGRELSDITDPGGGGRGRGRGAPPSPLPPRIDGSREGSIIVVVATDAPLLPHQLQRLARRVPMGIARVGGTASNGSGDIFIAFSTANPGAARAAGGPVDLKMLPNETESAFFSATIEAVEESIVNALVAAVTMTGARGRTVQALPHDRLREILRKYNRLHG
jgi:L-aminopeptidase/D-esterase-like protein